MDPNAVHRQFLPGYTDPSTWSSILYSYGGQGPAGSQIHDLRAEQQRAISAISENQRQISGELSRACDQMFTCHKILFICSKYSSDNVNNFESENDSCCLS